MDDLYSNIFKQFPYLPEEKLAEIVADSEIIILQEDETFVKIGEKSSRVAYVIQGMMRNYTLNHDGEEITVHFATEMQSIAPYSSIFLGLPATETTVAIEQTVLLTFDFNRFKEKAQHDALLLRLYADMIELTLVNAIQRIEDFTQKSPEQRYQRILDSQAYLIDRAPLKYLASYLGITAVSLSRIRKRLSRSHA